LDSCSELLFVERVSFAEDGLDELDNFLRGDSEAALGRHLLTFSYNQSKDSSEERVEEIVEFEAVEALVGVSPAEDSDDVVTQGVYLALNAHEEDSE